MGPSSWYKVWATICLVLIEGGYNWEMKEGLQNSDNEEAKESETCAAAAADLLSDANLDQLSGDYDLSEDPSWSPPDPPPLNKKNNEFEQKPDKYDIYNFKSSNRRNGDEMDSGQRDPSNGVQDYNYNSVYVDPLRTNQVDVEYPRCYKTANNNFDVFRVANRFRKIHQDMMHMGMEDSPRVSGFQKYLGNNQMLRGRDVRKKIPRTFQKEQYDK